jgi:hypothetical protein
MSLDEVIFLLCGWLVFAPRVSLVDDKSSVADEPLGMGERFPIQFHGHDLAPIQHPSLRALRAETVMLRKLCLRLDPLQFPQRRCRLRHLIRESASSRHPRGRRAADAANHIIIKRATQAVAR